jgi:hypothetical protein
MRVPRFAQVALLAVLGPHVSGCGGRAIFSQSEVDGLRPGTKSSEIVARFGAPSRVYELEFGGDVGEPWTGVVYEYDMQNDPGFRYVERPRKNRLVFAVVEGDTLLNNWKFEAIQARR